LHTLLGKDAAPTGGRVLVSTPATVAKWAEVVFGVIKVYLLTSLLFSYIHMNVIHLTLFPNLYDLSRMKMGTGTDLNNKLCIIYSRSSAESQVAYRARLPTADSASATGVVDADFAAALSRAR
jgi:hypothetical protein